MERQAVKGSVATAALLIALFALTRISSGCGDLQAISVDAGEETSCPLPVPPEGTYTYTTSGGIPGNLLIDIDGTTTPESVGPTLAMVVRHQSSGGGYTLLQNIAPNYLTTYSLTPTEVGWVTTGWQNIQFSNVSTVLCNPPLSWISCDLPMTIPSSCEGTTSSAGQYTLIGPHAYLGMQPVTTGSGDVVTTVHYQDTQTSTGSVVGAWSQDWYFRATDGLLVQYVVSDRVNVQSGSGSVNFSLTLDCTIQSLTPVPLTDGG